MVKAVESTVPCKHFRIAFCLAFLLLWNLSGTSQAFSIGRSISSRSDGGSLSIVRPSSARFHPTPLASTIENEPAAARSSIKARTPKIITIETKRMPSRESLSSTVNLPTPRRTRDLSKQGTITAKSAQESSEAPATTTSRPRRPLLRLMDNIWYILCPDLRKLSRHRRDLDSNKFVVSAPFRKEFAAVFLYLALGVISYRYIFEHWSLVDALYFTCVTFSTVGYGDICAKTVAGKLFSCVFGISGIALLGAAVARIGSRLVQAEMDAVKQAQKQSQRQLLQLNDKIHLDAILPHPHFPPFLATFWKAARYIIQSLAVVAAGGLFIGFLEGWKWYDSLYYGLMTASTIGLGDVVPVTQRGKLAAVVFIPMSVAAAGEILASVGIAMVERRQKRLFRSQLNKGLTMETLDSMDANHDGKVVREEYVSYMLMEMGLVTKDELEELWDQFERLDATKSGYLDHDDLILLGKLRAAGLIES